MVKQKLKPNFSYLLSLVAIALTFNFGCTPKVWQPVNNPTTKTVNLDCGEEQIVYTNSGNKMELLIFEFDNRCEFTAYAYKTTTDTILDAASQFQIPGYTKPNSSSYELSPGESFLAICSEVATVENGGCIVKFKIAATK